MPSFEELNSCDCILATYMEYIQPWLAAVYGYSRWKKLKVPVIARFDESFDRADLNLPGRWEDLKAWANYYSFPAAQDAEKLGGQWLPYGADTTVFNPTNRIKIYDIAFIGSLYPVRRNYLEKLSPHVGNDINFNCGQVVVQDLSGIRPYESTELLAENYRQIKVFFCLPPMSQLMVEKVVDVMASGTLVMFPKLLGAAAKNLEIFKDKEHIVYYEMGYLVDNAKQIRYWLENDEERQKVTDAGCDLVHKSYTLEQMLNGLLSPVSKEAAA